MINGDTAPHSMEPQFRKLGLGNISLKKGTPTMSDAQTVCKEGEKLKPDQAHILKLFGVAMATVGHYTVTRKTYWLTCCPRSDALARTQFQIVPQRCLDLKEGTVVHGAPEAKDTE